MTDRGTDWEPSPPARPQFEFREPPSATTPAAHRPRVVTVSFALWLAAVVAGLGTVVLTLFDLGPLRASLLAIVQRDFPNETPVTQDRAVAATMAILLGFSLLVVLLELAFAAWMRSGRSTRGVLVVLAILGAVGCAFILEAAPMVTVVGLGLSSALALVAAAVMYLPGSSRWFVR